MPEYIAKFLAIGIRQLLRGEGQAFLEEYYKYIEKIYNYQIPLRDIATKGKIKKSLREYKKDVQELTKAGRPKARQAWYELAIKENLNVDNGDTIYYINTGKSKSHADVKKAKHYLKMNLFNEREDVTKEIEKAYRAWKKAPGAIKSITIEEYINKEHPGTIIEDEIILNCMLVPRDIIDKEDDTYCSDVGEEFEYNVDKYIDMFNKRITPLLVCFSKDIRGNILISNPKDRPYFTEEQCELVSGEPNKPGDQDTYEQLMTMEDKEIKFWTKYNLVPPFIEECGMGKWEDIVSDYEERRKKEEEAGIIEVKEEYRKAIESLSESDVDNFLENGEIPSSLSKLIDIDPSSANFISKSHANAVIGSIDDFIDVKQRFEDEKGL